MAKLTQADDLRDLSVDKLVEQLDETRELLMRVRFQKATGELKDQNMPRHTRRKIAQLLTVLKEKGAKAPAAKAKPLVAEKLQAKEKPAEKEKPVKKKAKKAKGEA